MARSPADKIRMDVTNPKFELVRSTAQRLVSTSVLQLVTLPRAETRSGWSDTGHR